MKIIVNKKARENRNRFCAPRYSLEHIIMPKVVYDAAGAFLSSLLLERGSIFISLYEEIASDSDWNCPYQAEDFTVEPRLVQIEEDLVLAIRVAMPKAEEPFDCRSVYLCHNKNDGQILYFTSELTSIGNYLLCAWTEDKVHLNFGENADIDEFDRVVGLFKELVLDGHIADIEGIAH